MIIETFKRYELKYYVTGEQRKALLERASEYMNIDAYCIGGKNYPLYNLYFDSEDHTVMQNSLAKPPYKEKLRLRSYVCNPEETTKVFFELKKKSGGIVYKRRAVLPFGTAKAFYEGRPYTLPQPAPGKESVGDPLFTTRQVLKEIDRFCEFYGRTVKPYAYIAYDRFALFGKDNTEFRMTFDENIRSHAETAFDLNDDLPCEKILPPDVYLMELKISGGIPMWLTRAMSELGVRRSSFSKIGKTFTQYENGQNAAEEIGEFVARVN